MKYTHFILFALCSSLSFAEERTIPTVARCEEADYVAGETQNVVEISGFTYKTRCLKIAPGSTVTIRATSFHPLQGMEDVDGVANPLRARDAAKADVTTTFMTPGFYGYHCTHHG